MAEPISQKSRNEYLEKMCERYQRYEGRRARGKLITEFCEFIGHERKNANKLLGKKREPGCDTPPKRRGVEWIYGDEAVDVIFAIWLQGEQRCGKWLRPMLYDWLPHYERHCGQLSADVSAKGRSISAAQIDRAQSGGAIAVR